MINSINTSSLPAQTAPKPPAQDPALVITVTPNPGNVTSGDKSKNSADINITTPNREINASVSREQAFDQLENRLLRSAIGINKPGPVKTLLIADAISNSDSDIGEEAVELYTAVLTNRAVQSTLNSFNNNSSPANNNSNASTVNNATDFYIKSTLFFSTADRIGQKIDGFS